MRPNRYPWTWTVGMVLVVLVGLGCRISRPQPPSPPATPTPTVTPTPAPTPGPIVWPSGYLSSVYFCEGPRWEWGTQTPWLHKECEAWTSAVRVAAWDHQPTGETTRGDAIASIKAWLPELLRPGQDARRIIADTEFTPGYSDSCAPTATAGTLGPFILNREDVKAFVHRSARMLAGEQPEGVTPDPEELPWRPAIPWPEPPAGVRALGPEVAASIGAFDSCLEPTLLAFAPYWDRVALVMMADEAPWNDAQVEAARQEHYRVMDDLGLARKPVGITWGTANILREEVGWRHVDFTAGEWYGSADCIGDRAALIAQLTDEFEAVRALLEPAGVRMLVVPAGYLRNWACEDSGNQAARLSAGYAYADAHPGWTLGVMPFSWARDSGARMVPELRVQLECRSPVTPSGANCPKPPPSQLQPGKVVKVELQPIFPRWFTGPRLKAPTVNALDGWGPDANGRKAGVGRVTIVAYPTDKNGTHVPVGFGNWVRKTTPWDFTILCADGSAGTIHVSWPAGVYTLAAGGCVPFTIENQVKESGGESFTMRVEPEALGAKVMLVVNVNGIAARLTLPTVIMGEPIPDRNTVCCPAGHRGPDQSVQARCYIDNLRVPCGLQCGKPSNCPTKVASILDDPGLGLLDPVVRRMKADLADIRTAIAILREPWN